MIGPFLILKSVFIDNLNKTHINRLTLILN
jgi:hypothetical protein